MKAIEKKIIIKNLTKREIPKAGLIKGIIKKVFELENSPKFTLSVTYVNDTRMKRLNQRYRNKDSSTDVLAFSMREGRHIRGNDRFLGDIIISLDAAERQCKYFNTTKEKELKLYLIHGLLHLLGYDDVRPQDLRKMKKREGELLDKV